MTNYILYGSPRALAARALASAANTLRPPGVLIPETPASARREYVAARERGETVALALHRARLEIVAHEVLKPTGEGYTVDAAAMEWATSVPRFAALSGVVTDVDGNRILTPLTVPKGVTLKVSTEYDYHGDRVADAECYSPEDVKAWREDEWHFQTVVVAAFGDDGDELSQASIGGVEVGDYWPGTEPAQFWHVIPDLVREVLDGLPDDGDATCGQCGDDRTAVQGEHHGRTAWLCERHAVTCGTCGHTYSDTTPAGRCPREADHDDEDEPDDGLDDVDRELVSQHEDMTRRIDRARAILGNASGHYAPRDQRSLDALAALDGRDL